MTFVFKYERLPREKQERREESKDLYDLVYQICQEARTFSSQFHAGTQSQDAVTMWGSHTLAGDFLDNSFTTWWCDMGAWTVALLSLLWAGYEAVISTAVRLTEPWRQAACCAPSTACLPRQNHPLADMSVSLSSGPAPRSPGMRQLKEKCSQTATANGKECRATPDFSERGRTVCVLTHAHWECEEF